MEIVHVNVNTIRENNVRMREEEITDLSQLQAPITVKPKRSQTGIYAHRVAILDEKGNTVAQVVHDPLHPLPCGAKVWIQCEHCTQVVIQGD